MIKIKTIVLKTYYGLDNYRTILTIIKYMWKEVYIDIQ